MNRMYAFADFGIPTNIHLGCLEVALMETLCQRRFTDFVSHSGVSGAESLFQWNCLLLKRYGGSVFDPKHPLCNEYAVVVRLVQIQDDPSFTQARDEAGSDGGGGKSAMFLPPLDGHFRFEIEDS